MSKGSDLESSSASLRPALARDDAPTVIAIAILAFVLADVAHEVFGHGIGFLVAGGKSCILTTTRLIADHPSLGDFRSRIFDLGGPFGNLAFAALAWLAQRLLKRPAPALRLLLWLLMAFSLFWGFGYLISCGVLARGDWFALIRGVTPVWLWRILFVAVGIVLYRGSMKLSAAELHRIVPASGTEWQFRVRRLVLISYLAGGLIACAGATFDPRGAIEMLNSGAASSFLAALGLLRTPRLFRGLPDKPVVSDSIVNRNHGWILAAAIVSIFYIAILGPGVKVEF